MADTLACFGGRPHRQAKIQPTFQANERTHRLIKELIDGSVLSDFYGGRFTREFERNFAKYHGVDTAVAVNSGTSALHVALCAIGIRPGDEVIVPTLCYFSAVTAATQERAIPVLYDVQPGSLVADSEQILDLTTSRTRAVVVVHMYGVPVNLEPLRNELANRGIALIEDCGQAHGALAGGRLVGTMGDFGCFSFASPRHHISVGEGGMVIAKDPDAEQTLRQIVNKGKNNDWSGPVRQGYSYGLTEFASLVGIQGLDELDAELERRAACAAAYDTVLAGTGIVTLDGRAGFVAGDRPSNYRKLIRLPDWATGLRDWLVGAIEAENVSAKPPHPLIHKIPWMAEVAALLEQEYGVPTGSRPFADVEFPNAEQIYRGLIDLETGPNLTEDDCVTSAEAVARVWRFAMANRSLAAAAAAEYGPYHGVARQSSVGVSQ